MTEKRKVSFIVISHMYCFLMSVVNRFLGFTRYLMKFW